MLLSLCDAQQHVLGAEKTLTLLWMCFFTQSWVVLSHLDFFHTVGRKPAGSAFNASFPESSFTDRENCKHSTHSLSPPHTCVASV